MKQILPLLVLPLFLIQTKIMTLKSILPHH